MDNFFLHRLAQENCQLTDFERLVNVYHLAAQVLAYRVPGSFVELGCNAGLTSVMLQRLIGADDPSRELHVYDSFAGLPEPGPLDRYLSRGDCASTRAELEANFRRWEQPCPVVHPGWLEQTLPECLPPSIAFAYIDVDFHDATQCALDHVYPRMSEGGIICVDDYCDHARNERAWPGLPGVRIAVDEFFNGKPERNVVLAGQGDLAFCFIRKQSAATVAAQ